ncbi:MAG: flagellar export chaperone FliS [Bacteroidota bacterium]
MYNRAAKRLQYQRQAIATASPQQLIVKVYDIAVSACHRGDLPKLRACLVELISSLNFEAGGEVAERLYALYEFCLNQAVEGETEVVCELLEPLRDAWREVAYQQTALAA